MAMKHESMPETPCAMRYADSLTPGPTVANSSARPRRRNDSSRRQTPTSSPNTMNASDQDRNSTARDLFRDVDMLEQKLAGMLDMVRS